MTDTPAIETDAVVIGAGPVGLFQVFQLGLQEMRAHVIDSLPAPGGQCIELYADKPIYDIPATPVCTARELIDRLLRQIEPFRPIFHFGQRVDRLTHEADGRFGIGTSRGTQLLAKTVFIAGGVGSFQPRRLKLDGIASFEGRQLFYHLPAPASLAGLRVVLQGDSDEALQAAIALARPGPSNVASVTLLHRRDEFKAAPSTLAEFAQLREQQRLCFIAAQPVGFECGDDRLAALRLETADGHDQTIALDALVVLTGLSPRLGPIADWGLAIERKQLVVDPARFETSVPGIFAVGDVNTYPGKRRLIVCGFHEATLAAFAAAAHVAPGREIRLEYTTTSYRLHRLLGIAGTATA